MTPPFTTLRELDHANMKTMKSRRPAGADRGGIRKRGPTRTDRDGDMDMDSAGARGGKRARTSTGRSSTAGRAQPQGMADAIQKAIASNSGAQANVRQGRKGKAPNRDNLEQFSVRGWKESKAASNSDGGLESLIAFLERRMNAHSKTGPRAKISKVCSSFDMAVPSHEIRHHPLRCMLVSKDGHSVIQSSTISGHAGIPFRSVTEFQGPLRLANIRLVAR